MHLSRRPRTWARSMAGSARAQALGAMPAPPQHGAEKKATASAQPVARASRHTRRELAKVRNPHCTACLHAWISEVPCTESRAPSLCVPQSVRGVCHQSLSWSAGLEFESAPGMC